MSNGQMNKSASYDALTKLNRAEDTLGEDGALVFDSVSFALPNSQPKKYLIQDITGFVKVGQMLAIVGASGSGKTTTLDALALRMSSTIEGSIKINGKDITEELFHRNCAYVMQENYLWPALSVRENMIYAAQLYLGESNATVVEKVDLLIQAVGLQSCQDTSVGNILIRGISGGQKKRLSLALELLKSPAILYLDEPTSGLDSAAAAAIMNLLSKIAVDFQKAIICSIHQPESRIFLSFDQMMLLSKGRVAFFEPAKNACPYFAQNFDLKCPEMTNPADFLLEITNSDFRDDAEVDKLLDNWPKSAEAEHVYAAVKELTSKLPAERKSIKKIGFGSQFPILMKRTFQNYVRDPTVYLARVMLYVNMSAFFGLVYIKIGWQDPLKQSDIFNRVFLWNWLTAFMSFLATSAAPVFSLDAAIINRERMNNMYHPFSLFMAISVVQIPMVFGMSFMSLLPSYWMVGLNPKADRFLGQVLVFFTHLYWVETLALLLGVIIPNFIAALAVMSSIISMGFVLNGLFLETDSITWAIRWMHYISPFKYTWESQAWLEFAGTSLSECVDQNATCFGATGEDALAEINHLDDIKWGLWLLVVWGFIIFLRMIAYMALESKNGKKKLRSGLLALVLG